jgi:hypothetical protein
MKAQLCPVCNGSGKLTIEGSITDTSISWPRYNTCHGCSGKGWVEVSDEQPYINPIYPVYPCYPLTLPWWVGYRVTCKSADGTNTERD